MKKLVTALAALTLGLIAVPAAQSASDNECLGRKPNVIGTKKADEIQVKFGDADSTPETGAQHAKVFLNGKEFKVKGPVAIFADKGDDRIFYSQYASGDAVVCGGDGNDRITGTDYSRIHGGGGYDTVDVYDSCGPGVRVYSAEDVMVRAAVGDEYSPGYCGFLK